MNSVVVVTMVTEHEGCDPIDQGVQAVCADMPAFERWIMRTWPYARKVADHAWAIFTEQGEDLEAYILPSEREIQT
jgi:predicted phage tail protein